MGRNRRRRQSHDFSPVAVAPIVNIAQARSKREPIQPNRKPGVLIAVPSVNGPVSHSIALTFARAVGSNAVPECPFTFAVHVETSRRGVDYARNCIVRLFMQQTDFDWLMMIDDDQLVPDNFWMLCGVRDADIVSGITPVWVGNMDADAALRINCYGVNERQECYNLLPPPEGVTQPYRVPIVGTGAVAIRRRVFAPKPAGLGDTPFYFTYQDDRKVRGGEDINFSVDANRAGFVVGVHPQVRFDHVKAVPLMQIENYYHARRAMEIAGRQTTDAQRVSIG